MKQSWIALLSFLFVFFGACKNADKKNDGTLSSDALKATTDSLYKAVIKEHNEGMSGWMKIEDRQKQIKNLLDSIGKLPSKAQPSLDALKAKLNETTVSLENAYKEMDTWMSTMNLDSAENDIKQRLNYLMEQSERAKIVNALITSSLQKADSLLKTKF